MPIPNSRRPYFTLAALSAAALLSACTPKVTVNLGAGSDGSLTERVVLADDSPGDAKVAMIDVRGLIMDARRPGLVGSGSNPVDDLVSRLDLAARDPSIKAIVLRVNSPGGTVTGSDTMYHEVRHFAETTHKPVVACMGEVAASGGYYLSLAADHIIAQPTTVTASIGVIVPTMNFSEGLAKIGIIARNVVSGKNKDMAWPYSPMKDEQYQVLQTMVNDYYARFRGLVVARRPNLAAANVDEATDGRVVTGARAKELGLVDELGGIREAFAAAKSRAGVTNATLVKYAVGDYEPRTAYASSEPVAPAWPGASSSDTNLLKLDLSGGPGALSAASETSGFYFLWLPTIP